MGYFVVFSSKNYLCGVGPFCMYPGANKAGAARPSDLRGEIIKCQTGRPVTRTGDPRLRRIFARGTLRQKLPKPNPGNFGYLAKHLIKSPGNTLACYIESPAPSGQFVEKQME